MPLHLTSTRRVVAERVLFLIYAIWCLIALTEIVGRKLTGASPFPGFLANHNGNLAVSGFIVPFGLLAAEMRKSIEARVKLRQRPWVRALPALLVAAAAGGWTVYFVILELYPIYGTNVVDWRDLPGSIFGALVGTYAACRALKLSLTKPTIVTYVRREKPPSP